MEQNAVGYHAHRNASFDFLPETEPNFENAVHDHFGAAYAGQDDHDYVEGGEDGKEDLLAAHDSHVPEKGDREGDDHEVGANVGDEVDNGEDEGVEKLVVFNAGGWVKLVRGWYRRRG